MRGDGLQPVPSGRGAGRPETGQGLLQAQLVLALSIGIGVLRTSPGAEPLASSSSDDLVEPMRRVIEVLLA